MSVEGEQYCCEDSDKSYFDSHTSSDSPSDAEPDSRTPFQEDEPSSARPKSPHSPYTLPQPPKSKPKKKGVKEESRQETNLSKDSGIGSNSSPMSPPSNQRPPTSTQVPSTETNDTVSQFVNTLSPLPIKPNTLTHSSKEGSDPSQGGLVHQNETAHAMPNHGAIERPSLSLSQPSSEDSGNWKHPRQEISGGPSEVILPRDTTTKPSSQESQGETPPSPRILVDDAVTEAMSNSTTDIKTFPQVNLEIPDCIIPTFPNPSPQQQSETHGASAAGGVAQSPNQNIPYSISHPTCNYELPSQSPEDFPNFGQVMPPCWDFFPITCEPIPPEEQMEVESVESAMDTSERAEPGDGIAMDMDASDSDDHMDLGEGENWGKWRNQVSDSDTDK